MRKQTEKEYLELWQEYRENIHRATPVDLNETEPEKRKRIARLEADDESWFKYYFPSFYSSDPADFHKKSTKKVMDNAEYFLVRSWARELSKSGRTMMEVIKLAMTGKKKNILLVSNSSSNAERLLLPYKAILEKNNRIISDYGIQERHGSWTASEFITTKGVSFRALGAGQSPRGTRKDELRPDVIIIDDIDTDEECRNPDIIKEKVAWIEQALYATRSISNPLLLIVCGNIIAEYCCVTELGKLADSWEIINIRDKNGTSTWPQKNTEEMIDRVLSKISYNSGQKEYFNNPITEGAVFKEITYGKCPPLHSCDVVVVYADPATSNKDKTSGSPKSVNIVGYKGLYYYVYKVWLDTCNNDTFIGWLYAAHEYLKANKVDTYRMYIENNTLQDPFYTQVFVPIINIKARQIGYRIPITPDDRKKPEKFFRIEGTLEPTNRNGFLVFNEAEKEDPHMGRMKSQMLGVSPNAKRMDGPDCLEGAVWRIQNRTAKKQTTYVAFKRESKQY